MGGLLLRSDVVDGRSGRSAGLATTLATRPSPGIGPLRGQQVEPVAPARASADHSQTLCGAPVASRPVPQVPRRRGTEAARPSRAVAVTVAVRWRTGPNLGRPANLLIRSLIRIFHRRLLTSVDSAASMTSRSDGQAPSHMAGAGKRTALVCASGGLHHLL